MISVHELSKGYGDIKALEGLSFEVQGGELFGVLGPDGAGKTTLFRILLSLLLPGSGTVRVGGLDPVRDLHALRKKVGYMPGKFALYEDLSVEENLQFFASVFGTTPAANYELIKEVYQQIEPFKKRPAGKLSGGMKQKLALSCALIHRPELLVLDEPTTGVDAVSRSEFWALLKKLKAHGITILVATPYMDEAALCDRVALMQKGRLLTVASPGEVVRDFEGLLYGVSGGHPYGLIQACRAFEPVVSVFPFGEELHVRFRRDDEAAEHLVDHLKSSGFSGAVVRPIAPNIEDCFMALMATENDLKG